MPNQVTPGGTPPPTRRDRREAARRDRRLAEARTAAPRPAWQSPMVLVSIGAVAIGLVVVLLASGMLGGRGGGSGDLLVPIRPTPTDLVDPANPRAVGRAGAPVTIDVWSDFQCPACGFFARSVEPDLIDEFVKAGTVRVVYRDFAFLDGGQADGESQRAAISARCAGDQGKFWPFHDYLFENQSGENQGTFSTSRMDQIATAVGLDLGKFHGCVGQASVADAVRAEKAEGSQAGVGSTPTLAINGVLQRAGAIPMADTSSGPGLRSLVAAELARLSPAPSGASPAPSGAPTASP